LTKQNKITLFPRYILAIFLWFIGWSLYWIGARKQSVSQKSEVKQEKLVFTIIPTEEKLAECDTIINV